MPIEGGGENFVEGLVSRMEFVIGGIVSRMELYTTIIVLGMELFSIGIVRVVFFTFFELPLPLPIGI